MATKRKLPARSEVPRAHTWDLSPLYPNDAAWERAFAELQRKVKGFRKFKGTLGRSAKQLRACLDFDAQMDRAFEKLGTYAHLKMTEDLTNSRYVGYEERYGSLASTAMQESSFLRPELMALPETPKMENIDMADSFQ